MAQIKWTNTSGGDFNTGANWMGGAVPGAGDDALLTTTGTYTVTSNQSNTVLGVQIVQHVTLAIAGGTFTDSNGTDGGTNAGVIAIGDNTSFFAGGTIAGTGTIDLNSAGNVTSFYVSDAGLTLSGGGALVITDNSQNYVRAQSGGDVLTNASDTISGSGQFGYGSMTFINSAAGVVNANAATNALIFNFGATFVTNAGLIEATGAAGLDVSGSGITQTGTGTLKAIGSGHAISLDNATVIGGTLATTGGGVIQSVSNATLSGVTISTGSVVAAQNNTSVFLDGTIVNKGTLQSNSAGNVTSLYMNTAITTLTGGGKVVLTDNSQNYLRSGNGGVNKLVNVNNTISGSGNFGYGSLLVDNQAGGTINSVGVNGLLIDNGGQSFTNEGLIEATGVGALTIESSIITNSSTIGAFGAGTAINLNSSTIIGGTIATSGGGVIQSVNNAYLDGSTAGGAVTLAAGSQLLTLNNTGLSLYGTFDNLGTVALDSVGNGTFLYVQTGTLTLTGGGIVTMTDSSQNYIRAGATGNLLVNVNNTFAGSGDFGYGSLAVDNQAAGVIDSTGTAGLLINNGNQSFTNEGVIEDTGAGALTIQGSTIVNHTTIGAFGAGTDVVLDSATIEGGTLQGTGGGMFQTVNSGNIDGATNGTLTLASNTELLAPNNTTLFFYGAINNLGTIALTSAGNGTFFTVQTSTLTLTGGGKVTMTDNTQNYIRAGATGNKLINVNNTFVGSGYFGYGSLIVDNQAHGTIDATGASGLLINNGNQSFTNEGLIENTGSGALTIQGSTIFNTGTVLATGAGATINFDNGTIQGGVVKTSGGAFLQSLNNATLDGSSAAGALSLAAGTQVVTPNNTNLILDGTISNAGTISLNSIGNGTFLYINTPVVKLTGGGAVVLSDNTQNYIRAGATGDQLVNVNNTISGSGFLNYGGVALDNQAGGTIEQTGTSGLNVNPGNQIITNEGVFEAAGTGGIFMQATTLTNTGTLAALSDSSFTINADAVLTNYNAGTLTGGTYKAVAASGAHTATLAINSIGSITVDAAHLVLSGTGASITAGGTSVVSTLKTITSKGELDVQNGAIYADPSTLTNGGKILLAGTLSATGITNTPTGSITANGGLGSIATTGKLLNNGLLQATSGGTLQLSKGSVTNVGSIDAQAGGKVTLIGIEKNTNLVAGVLTGGNWGAIGAGATLALQDGTITSDAATLTLSGAGSVIASEKTNVALEATLGTIAAGGILNLLNGRGFASTFATGVADNGLIALGGGTFSDTSLTIGGGTGTFQGAGTLAGAVTDNGNLDSAVVAGGNGTLSVTGAITGTGLLEANSATELVAGAGFAVGGLSIASSGTIAGAGSITAAGTVAGLLALGAAGTLSAGSVTVQIGGAITGAGIAASGTVADSGAITLTGGTLSASSITVAAGATLGGFGTVAQAVADSGTIAASGGALVLASASGTGSATIASGATLESTAALTVAGVTFATGSGETLALGTPGGNTAVITGFAAGTTIDLLNTTVTSFAFNPATDTLSFKDGSTSLGFLRFTGSYVKTNFSLVSDGHNGVDITFVPSAVADLHGAVAATTGSAAAAGLTAATPAPAVLPHTAPEVGFSLNTDTGAHAADGLMMHLPAVL